MKILQINSAYPGGSTGAITESISKGLRLRGEESIVLYGRGKESDEVGTCRVSGDFYARLNRIISMLTGFKYGGCLYSTAKTERIISREKPDIVHLQCINNHFVNIYRLIDWLKLRRIPVVITLHAEFMYTANCSLSFSCEGWKSGCKNCPRPFLSTGSLFYRSAARGFERLRRAFSDFESPVEIVSVSPWLYERAGHSPMLSAFSHRIIKNGVDISVFRPRDTTRLKQSYGDKIILHVTPLFSDEPGDNKGGAHIIELAKRMRDFTFLIAGKSKAAGPLPGNLVLLGNISDREKLAECYSAASVTVVASREETFSMACAESLCCGTPVAGFCAGGPESITPEGCGCFVPYGDMDALEKAVKKLSAFKSKCNEKMIAEAARSELSSKKMADAYIELYGRML